MQTRTTLVPVLKSIPGCHWESIRSFTYSKIIIIFSHLIPCMEPDRHVIVQMKESVKHARRICDESTLL